MTPNEQAAEVERLRSLMIKRSFFVMFRKIPDPAKLEPLMLDHYRWIIGLEKEGLVFASGPLFAEDGSPPIGMTIFRARDRQAAVSLAERDPFVTGGAATFEIQRWQVAEGRISISFDFSDQTYRFD